MFHLLVVDDDKNTRLFMTAALEANGYEVTCAEDGLKALEILDEKHIDLIIADIMMPNMEGYELTRRLREAQNVLPILMISAKQLPEDRKKGFLNGIDDYMTKPVNTEEMVLRIKALLRRAKVVSEKRLTVGDVVLDYDTLTVTKNDEVIELPKKEFNLLFLLLSYPGKIFTRIQLMDEIWGADSDTGWETVTVHIGRLRKKFERWTEFSIVSVRGLGYKAVKNV